MVPLSHLEFVTDVQPLCRSHAHLFEKDNLHPTTRGSLTVSLTRAEVGGQVQSVSRGGKGEGEGEVGRGSKIGH